ETRKFFSGLKDEAGEILDRELASLKSNHATYKTTFDRGIFAFNVALDAHDKIAGFVIKPYLADSLPKLERNVSSLILPFQEPWTVVWGGDSHELNHHVHNQAQKHA